MTVRDKVGQLFMIGFEGTELSREFSDWLQQYRPGGVIVFSRNLVDPAQIAELTSAIQEHSPHSPLLIAIDQEGGRVSRLPNSFTILPAAATIGACSSRDLAYRAAAAVAKELRAVGINMNMAPVLDVNTNLSNPIIGDRAYSQDPEHVCQMAAATISGLHDHGIIACGKHFPGHGETTVDSHKELPVVNLSRERLTQIELRPFRDAIDHGLATMMTAHVRYSALDSNQPATLSSAILTDLLRDELGFSGLILSDDLEMNAIVDHSSMGKAAIQSLQAGVDMLVICHRRDRQVEAIEAIERALSDGDLEMSRIDASLTRLSLVKNRFLASHQPVDVQSIQQTVGSQAHRELLAEIQQASA